MRLRGVVVLVFGMMLAGCSTAQPPASDQTPAPAVTPQVPSAPTNPFERTDLNQAEQALVGSWHAAPHVAAGYHDRYLFDKDHTFVFLPDDYVEHKAVVQSKGRWYMAGDTLHLLTTRVYDAQINATQTQDETTLQVMWLLPEQNENRVVISLNGQKYWAMPFDMAAVLDDNLLATLPAYVGNWVGTIGGRSVDLVISKVTPLQIEGQLFSAYRNGARLPAAEFRGSGFGRNSYQVQFTDSFDNEFTGQIDLVENQVVTQFTRIKLTEWPVVDDGKATFVRQK